MRVVVLGATGMLGHKLLQRLRSEFEVAGTIRGSEPDATLSQALPGIRVYSNVCAEDVASLKNAIKDWQAKVVLNCIGIIKQTKAASDPIQSISINALLPHQLARISGECGAKLIHFSTDCVFSGRRGNYVENDPADPVDLYGYTKYLGEIRAPGALTLRTSFIGRELRGHLGLLDWFLSQWGGRVSGYARALYSGITTNAMADVLAWLIHDYPDLEGVWHVSAEPIGKFDLLQIVNRIYGAGIEIVRDETFVCDRRLDSTRFRNRTAWLPRSWSDMIVEVRAEEAMYGSS
jgi:dTDP-4-dehydrorhamnose reductase